MVKLKLIKLEDLKTKLSIKNGCDLLGFFKNRDIYKFYFSE